MTYTIDGDQYVAVMAGLGGGGGQAHPPGSAAYIYGNLGRLIAFKIGGGEVPLRPKIEREVEGFPLPPVENTGTEQQISLGKELYLKNCAKCHSSLDGRGSGIPDLRLMSAETHEQFNAIVLEGTLAARGMGSFANLISEAENEALHAFLIDLAWEAWREEQPKNRPHEPPSE